MTMKKIYFGSETTTCLLAKYSNFVEITDYTENPIWENQL